jgi:hypothetical protein
MNKYQILSEFWFLYDNFGIKIAMEFLEKQNYNDDDDELDNLFKLLQVE